MRRRKLHLAFWLALAPLLLAQQNSPHAAYVYPAGGRQGTELEVTIGGQFLFGANSAITSSADVQATVIEYVRPPNAMQANDLREKLRPLMEKRAAAARQQQRAGAGAAAVARPVLSAEEAKTLADITQQLANFNRARNNPALADLVRLRIKIAPEAAPGRREVRLVTAAGLSNPVAFWIGDLPEFTREPVTTVNDPLRAAQLMNRAQGRAAPPDPPMAITLPATVNGQIMPGAADRYTFRAVKGQHLVVEARARALIPYISDAVPGWFQATLALYDSAGKEVAYAGSYRFHPDPVFSYDIATDGEYTLAIRDSIYRGREDFVYRIAAGELPFITSIFPLGGKAGGESAIEVSGWNVPATKLKLRNDRTGARAVSLKTVNAVPFAVDTLPEASDKEPNNDTKAAQELKLPVIVNGRIGTPGDRDVFRFKGRAGDEIVAEVFARRLDSPVDSVLRLTDARGRELAANDDFEDAGSGLNTHHADSRLLCKLPANGTYYLYLADVQQGGGKEYAYRLRVSKPQPDFELRVAPASVALRPGLTVPLTVYALRRDGMAGEIALSLKDAPAGFVLSGGTIPANQEKVRVTLSAPVNVVDQTFPLNLEGRSAIGGRAVTRAATPAEDMTQAFAYHHLVPADKWMAHVARGGPGRQALRVETGGTPFKVPAGSSAAVRVPLPAAIFARQLRCTLNDPPEGITIERVIPSGSALEILVHADGSKAKPGLQGNLIVDVSMERPAAAAAAGAPARPAQRVALGTLPAIPFQIVSGSTAVASRK